MFEHLHKIETIFEYEKIELVHRTLVGDNCRVGEGIVLSRVGEGDLKNI